MCVHIDPHVPPRPAPTALGGGGRHISSSCRGRASSLDALGSLPAPWAVSRAAPAWPACLSSSRQEPRARLKGPGVWVGGPKGREGRAAWFRLAPPRAPSRPRRGRQCGHPGHPWPGPECGRPERPPSGVPRAGRPEATTRLQQLGRSAIKEIASNVACGPRLAWAPFSARRVASRRGL